MNGTDYVVIRHSQNAYITKVLRTHERFHGDLKVFSVAVPSLHVDFQFSQRSYIVFIYSTIVQITPYSPHWVQPKNDIPKLQMDENAFTAPFQLTKNMKRQIYPSIEPSNPSLKATDKIVIITGAGGGLGCVGYPLLPNLVLHYFPFETMFMTIAYYEHSPFVM